MRSMSDRRSLALAALALASAFCISLLVARWVYSEPGAYRFLAWNLFLAWIPLVAAVTVYDMHRRGVGLSRLLPLAALWLLFLPNAPYLLTDLIHLGSRDDAPTAAARRAEDEERATCWMRGRHRVGSDQAAGIFSTCPGLILSGSLSVSRFAS